MTVMGERSPEDWTAELVRTGHVVFPLRRRPVLWQFAYLMLPSVMVVIWLPDALDAGGGQRISAFVAVASYVVAAAGIVWQLIVQRPVVTVDREGIRRGRKFRPWAEIGAIGIAGGTWFARTLPIIPKDAWAKDLILHSQHVRDLPAFRRWLEVVLEERRRSAAVS